MTARAHGITQAGVRCTFSIYAGDGKWHTCTALVPVPEDCSERVNSFIMCTMPPLVHEHDLSKFDHETWYEN